MGDVGLADDSLGNPIRNSTERAALQPFDIKFDLNLRVHLRDLCVSAVRSFAANQDPSPSTGAPAPALRLSFGFWLGFLPGLSEGLLHLPDLQLHCLGMALP